jgi:hypothetical protein
MTSTIKPIKSKPNVYTSENNTLYYPIDTYYNKSNISISIGTINHSLIINDDNTIFIYSIFLTNNQSHVARIGFITHTYELTDKNVVEFLNIGNIIIFDKENDDNDDNIKSIVQTIRGIIDNTEDINQPMIEVPKPQQIISDDKHLKDAADLTQKRLARYSDKQRNTAANIERKRLQRLRLQQLVENRIQSHQIQQEELKRKSEDLRYKQSELQKEELKKRAEFKIKFELAENARKQKELETARKQKELENARKQKELETARKQKELELKLKPRSGFKINFELAEHAQKQKELDKNKKLENEEIERKLTYGTTSPRPKSPSTPRHKSPSTPRHKSRQALEHVNAKYTDPNRILLNDKLESQLRTNNNQKTQRPYKP